MSAVDAEPLTLLLDAARRDVWLGERDVSWDDGETWTSLWEIEYSRVL